ncbi:hypothetical protein ACTXKN_12550 [Brachybacterium alimentarium]|uniref:hypothetical protein n=1 Tax=Brachybacterium alimentarium TaxID=47845 RepID=UPI003FD2B7D7
MTDDFTTAARAEAEEYARTPGMNVGTVRDRIAEAHADGWAAARDHLAAQEPTAAEVRAAKADAWDEGYGDCWNYHQSNGLAGTYRNPYRTAEQETGHDD